LETLRQFVPISRQESLDFGASKLDKYNLQNILDRHSKHPAPIEGCQSTACAPDISDRSKAADRFSAYDRIHHRYYEWKIHQYMNMTDKQFSLG
jgi:hypothetical protein